MRAELQVPTYDLCGVDIAAATPARAVGLVIDAARRKEALEVHLCNAYTLSLVDSDARLAAALERAHLNLPDGAPVAWFGRAHGVRGPVRGPLLVTEVAEAGRPHGLRHYFYGGAEGVAQQLGRVLEGRFAGLQVAGAESPPFADPSPEVVSGAGERMTAAGADIVWIGLGTPRQDYVVPMLADHVSVPVIPVGAAFDFLTGRVQEAPRFLHGSGLEWTYRLAREPRRLWRRYLLGNPRFVASALRHRRHR